MAEVDNGYLLAAGGLLALVLIVCACMSRPAPKGFFHKPIEHVEIRTFRRKTEK